MSMYLIEWEIEDGYVGSHRPQKSTISLQDLADIYHSAQDDFDLEQSLYDYVEEDFRQRISFTINDMENLKVCAEQAFEALKDEYDE